jgi:hypothetical protein
MKKLHKSPTQIIPRIVKGVAPTAAIASGLLSQPSFGASGDLDPTFGDMGRASFPLHGAAFRVQELTADESLIAGGKFVFHVMEGCEYYSSCHFDGFIGQISPTGSLDFQ